MNTIKVSKINGYYRLYISDNLYDIGYPYLASALRRAACMGYDKYTLNTKTRQIPNKYRAI